MLDLLEIGKPIAFRNMPADRVIKAYTDDFDAKGIEARLTYWTDPPTADPALPCRTVFILRCDGMSDDDIEVTKAEMAATLPAASERFIFNPAKWNAQFPPKDQCKPLVDKVPKATKIRWEQMQIGDRRTQKMYTKDLKYFLGRAMIQRGLDWIFECKRIRCLEDTDKRNPAPVWQVTRIR